MATHSNTLAWKMPWTEEPVGYSPGVTKSWTRLSDIINISQLWLLKDFEKWNAMQPVQKYRLNFFSLEISQFYVSKEKKKCFFTTLCKI